MSHTKRAFLARERLHARISANIQFVPCSQPGRVVIRDLGPWDQYKTVTNDAENVVEFLVEAEVLRPGDRLFYFDSSGQLDEILVKDGRFVAIASACFLCAQCFADLHELHDENCPVVAAQVAIDSDDDWDGYTENMG